MGSTLELRAHSMCPESFERFSLYFGQNVYLSEMVCRVHDWTIHTQSQSHTLRSWDLTLNLVSTPYLLNPLNDFH